ncbi:ketoreductase [Grosmannia clavigera kw1407]|uniref:Ketoreductase n=1 Tax=Grosmannia clavigera (strain kw1407 / UAMH 11150) TaxID=655863 RepID=F0XJI4_GROCL|nr:ketoreductase [Grosmannia clavigera kw1407]EFX02085.1 ketoreductase [Grosmannia clavigera kw1407]
MVVATVRTAAKGEAVLDSIDARLRPAVSYVLVNDVAQEGAFDRAVQAEPPFDFVIHTASPYQVRIDDPVRDLLEPAIRGTTGILRSVQNHAPSVRRIVLTSSSAAMLNPAAHAAVYDESFWRPVTWAEAQLPQNAYEASKVFAERAAWSTVTGADLETAGEPAGDARSLARTPAFDLAVINGTYTFGPVQRWLRGANEINASNHRIRDLIAGGWLSSKTDSTGKHRSMPPTRPVFTWVDVRDVALAHVRALLVPQAGGRRFYVVGGHFSNGRLAHIVREMVAEAEKESALSPLVKRIPPLADTPDDLPADVYRFNNRRSREVLGLTYRSLEESVMDTVYSILSLEAAGAEKQLNFTHSSGCANGSMETYQVWNNCLDTSGQAGPENPFDPFRPEERSSYQTWQQQNHQQDSMQQDLPGPQDYQANMCSNSFFPSQGTFLLQAPTIPNIMYPTATYQQPTQGQMTSVGVFPTMEQAPSDCHRNPLPVPPRSANATDDELLPWLSSQSVPTRHEYSIQSMTELVSSQQPWHSWSQNTQFQQQFQQCPRFVPPVQISSGGLLSPDGSGLQRERPQTPAAHRNSKNNKHSNAASPSASTSSSPPSPEEKITLADVNRFMSPCRRAEMRRYRLRANHGNAWSQPVDVDGLYAELQEEVLESRRNQRDRDAWVEKHLRNKNRSKKRERKGRGANSGGNTKMDVDTAHPVDPTAPSSMAYPRMLCQPNDNVPWFAQELPQRVLLQGAPQGVPQGMRPAAQPFQAMWAPQQVFQGPYEPSHNPANHAAGGEISQATVNGNMSDAWNIQANAMGRCDGQYTARDWPFVSDWTVQEQY